MLLELDIYDDTVPSTKVLVNTEDIADIHWWTQHIHPFYTYHYLNIAWKQGFNRRYEFETEEDLMAAVHNLQLVLSSGHPKEKE